MKTLGLGPNIGFGTGGFVCLCQTLKLELTNFKTMNIVRRTTALAVLFSLSLSLALLPRATSAAYHEPVRAPHAMVAAQHELASQIGVDVMKRGGNAVDAAIAVALALAVVYPEAGNLGGGGFMLIRFADGRTTAIDYREMAPKAATRDVFVDKDGNLIKGEGSSTVGYRAAGVPGTPAGMDFAFRKYSSKKLSWSALVEPARLLAQNGYVLSDRLAKLFRSAEKELSQYGDSKKIFLNGGKLFNEGDVLKQPELAKTLGRMQRLGAREFYTGRTADLIAADMKANNGLITKEDLANYFVKERVPLKGSYRGHEIITMPPPSSGGIILLQILKMLEQREPAKLAQNSAERYHLLAEMMRRAFADRSEYMGDPDFSKIPVSQLTDVNYAISRAADIRADRATPSSEVKPGNIVFNESNDTTHFTIVDPQGNVVSNTYTLNDLYGSGVTAKGTGVLLNDEMDDFAARPGKPNLFGLIQGERNAVGAGKRPLSSMTPTIVMRKDGSVWFATGARGGPRILTAVLQIVINMIDYKMNIQAAIDAPRVHHQWMPDVLNLEFTGFSSDTVRILEGLGHKVNERAYNAQATGIEIEEKTGVRLGARDARGDGAAKGY